MPPLWLFQVVANAAHRGCVVLDLCEHKAAQLKFLPGLLRAAEDGHYAVVGGWVGGRRALCLRACLFELSGWQAVVLCLQNPSMPCFVPSLC